MLTLNNTSNNCNSINDGTINNNAIGDGMNEYILNWNTDNNNGNKINNLDLNKSISDMTIDDLLKHK